jgi:hypothetical protein
VLPLQESPRPKKNPHWKIIPIAESGALEMPAGSHFQCIYNPVVFHPYGDERGGMDRWELLRTVRCSNDGWVTYSQATHLVTIDPRGTVTPASEQTELALHETIDGHPVQTTVILKTR